MKKNQVEQVRVFLSKDKIEDAVNLILNSSIGENHTKELVLLKSNINRLKTKYIKGIVSVENYNLEKNRIIDRTLELLEISLSYIEEDKIINSNQSKHRDNQIKGDSTFRNNQIVNFLKDIGIEKNADSNSDRYLNLEKLFVKPREYNSITDSLEKNNFVLILGDPQVGKTYTAIYLLLQYYKQGYHPIWESVRDIEELSDISFRRVTKPKFDLENYVNQRLDSKNIIYIEDPWGKVNFELSEDFTIALESLIKKLSLSDAKLIITSRSNIFEKLGEVIGSEFAVWMKAEMLYGGKNKSYSISDRKQMVDKYHNLYNIHHRNLGAKLVDEIASKLHSPNSIREYFYLTRTQLVDHTDDKIIELSSDLDYQFSLEIIQNSKPYPYGKPHKTLFVLWLYIVEHSRYFFRANRQKRSYGFKEQYEKLLSIMNNPIIDAFQDSIKSLGDRIIKRSLERFESYYENRDSEIYQFSHPIYLEGTKRAVKDASVNRMMKQIISSLGDSKECSICKFKGYFLHTYYYKYNELNPQGELCPKCNSWGMLSYVLEGVSLSYSLEPLYLDFKIIKQITLIIGKEKVLFTIPINKTPSVKLNDLKQKIQSVLNHICEKRSFNQEQFEIFIEKGVLKEGSLLLDTNDEIVVKLALNEEEIELSLNQLEKILIEESTDIDW